MASQLVGFCFCFGNSEILLRLMEALIKIISLQKYKDKKKGIEGRLEHNGEEHGIDACSGKPR